MTLISPEILNRFQDVQQRGENQYQCRCPAHDDAKASLSIGVSDDGSKVLLRCFARCEKSAILQASGLIFSDLFLNSHAGSGKQNQKRNTSHKKGRLTAAYNYTDENGNLLFQSCRLESTDAAGNVTKDFRQRRPLENGKWAWNIKGITKVPYRLPKIVESQKTNQPVFIVEGEKDVASLERGQFIATSNSGGANVRWPKAWNKYFLNRDVVILPDNDEPGKDHASQIATTLATAAKSIKILELPNLPEKGDVTDWIEAGHSLNEFKQLVEKCPTWTAGTTKKPEKVLEADDDPHRLAEMVLRNTYYYDDAPTLRYWRESYQYWNGQAYSELSYPQLRAHTTGQIKAEFDRINLAKQAAPNVGELPFSQKVTLSLTSNVLQAINGKIILSDSMEMPCWLPDEKTKQDNTKNFVALQNGLLNMRALLAGENVTLQAHTPNWFSANVLPYEYNPNADCPQWLEFIQRNLEGDAERIRLIQEWFGYNLIHDTSFQKFLVLEGEGANGKSVVCAALAALLGRSNVSRVPLEMFGERFQLTATIGKLANISGDVGEIDKAAEGILKGFTSGDEMNFDRKNRQPITAAATARLTMAMNNRPRFSDRSDGLWRRMMIVPMRIQIPEHERIHGMDKQEFWINSGEMPGIFNWACGGLYNLKSQGCFTEPELSTESNKEYKREMNPARAYLEDCFQTADENANVDVDETYKAYRNWCEKDGTRPLNKSNFGKEVKRVFPASDKKRLGSDGNRFHVYTCLKAVERDAFQDNDGRLY